MQKCVAHFVFINIYVYLEFTFDFFFIVLSEGLCCLGEILYVPATFSGFLEFVGMDGSMRNSTKQSCLC